MEEILSLTKEKQTDVLIEKEWVEELLKKGRNCLLGKLMMKKAVNMEAMKMVFMKLWKI